MEKTIQMKKIALFGGAFDPPTLAHALVLNILLNSKKFDQIWIVPSGNRTDKQYHVTSAERLLLLEAFVAELFPDSPLRIETIQLEERLPGSWTVDLIRHLQQHYPDHEFSWVIGSDLISQVANWKEGAWLLDQLNFVVIKRSTEELSKFPSKRMQIIESELTTTISSTLARQLIKQEAEISAVLTEAVKRLICQKRLYRNSN